MGAGAPDRRRRAVSRAAALALAGSLLGFGAPAGAEDAPEEWQRRLREVGRALLAEEYAEADAASRALAGEMADSIVGGAGAELLLAMASTYRALAAAGLDRREEAIWYWQVAQQLHPELTQLDLTRFGEVGGFLAMHPSRQPSERVPRSRGERGSFEPAERIESPRPDFPAGRAFRGLRVDVVVQVVVDATGRPRQPVILASEGEPTLVWATLEALRGWRFEPARRDGRPESSLYRLTASYVVPEG